MPEISNDVVCATSKASDQPAHTRSLIRAFASRLSILYLLMTIWSLEFLSLKGGCRGSSESTHVKIPHCWKLHALAHLCSQDEAAISMLENNVGLLAEPFEEIVPKMDETLGNLMKGLLITVEDESREEQEFDLDTHAQDCTIL